MIVATARDNHEEGETMKNPLDSLGQTVTLGFVLTLIVIGLIHVIA
jgi:hypothetical protein